MFGAPDVWDALMRKIAGISAAYLEVQVGAGASAVQLFDSWAGALTPRDYREHVMPHSARVLARAGALGVPRIHFGVGTSNLLGLMGEAGADVVGVDWRTPLDDAIAAGRRPGGAGQPRPDPRLRPDRGDDRPRRRDHRGRPRRHAATSSTSATACSLDRPRPAQAADGVRPVLLARSVAGGARPAVEPAYASQRPHQQQGRDADQREHDQPGSTAPTAVRATANVR